MHWQNTVTIITCASSEIGKATLELLRTSGSLVYNLDITPPAQPDPISFLAMSATRKA